MTVKDPKTFAKRCKLKEVPSIDADTSIRSKLLAIQYDMNHTGYGSKQRLEFCDKNKHLFR